MADKYKYMKMKLSIRGLILLISGCLIVACSSQKKAGMNGNNQSMGMASPPAIVYKTKKDYYSHVPVQLSDNKQKIVSYPAQSDIRRGNTFSYPTKLTNGYLLDNRGISVNTGFLRFTYEDYYNMDLVLTAENLMNYVIDDDPFTEFYEVGRRYDYHDIESEINGIINNGGLKKYKNLAK